MTPETPTDDPGSALRFWHDVPEPWKRSLRERCLLAGATNLLDSRERFDLRVGDQQVTMMLKYQGPVIDLGWLAEEGKLVVRLSQMYYEQGRGGQDEDIVDGVAFGHLLDPREILPLTAPRHHWSGWEQWWELDEPPAVRWEPA